MKKILALILIATLAFSTMGMAANAANEPVKSTWKITVNGKPLTADVIMLHDNNFYRLADILATADDANYQTPASTLAKAEVVTFEGYTYYMLRDILPEPLYIYNLNALAETAAVTRKDYNPNPSPTPITRTGYRYDKFGVPFEQFSDGTEKEVTSIPFVNVSYNYSNYFDSKTVVYRNGLKVSESIFNFNFYDELYSTTFGEILYYKLNDSTLINHVVIKSAVPALINSTYGVGLNQYGVTLDILNDGAGPVIANFQDQAIYTPASGSYIMVYGYYNPNIISTRYDFTIVDIAYVLKPTTLTTTIGDILDWYTGTTDLIKIGNLKYNASSVRASVKTDINSLTKLTDDELDALLDIPVQLHAFLAGNVLLACDSVIVGNKDSGYAWMPLEVSVG